VEDDGVATLPARGGGLPLACRELDQGAEALRAEELEEHLLSVPVGPPVEERDAALVLKQRERRRWQRPSARQALALIEGPCRLGAGQADRRPEHQPGLEDVAFVTAGALADEFVAVAQ
jgi:hypothetical protein